MEMKLIATLREITGAGISDCNRALKETGSNMDKSVRWLREKGIASAVKKAGRSAKQGVVQAYIHSGGTLGVLVEINCETDFVAKTDNFKDLAKEISMQIAAMSPFYINREQVPENVLESERKIYSAHLKEEGKPGKVWDKIIEGKIEKFYQQICLYDQIYMKDASGKQTIKDLINEAIGKIGENIIIKRFVRFKLGEE
ncbi:MAG: elongation factor Ts [Elusimicrobiota bacterium]|jgi:elongation factor Ts|nr:elongation factor Ts [Elusimicrobiota bacterium]